MKLKSCIENISLILGMNLNAQQNDSIAVANASENF